MKKTSSWTSRAQDIAGPRRHADPVLQVSLRKLADEYQMRADELEDEAIWTAVHR